MGGDHKCPVCAATFTRPQHVVRHMRSHTGDRPYKCQHCGDQFSRSDLLSRHVNKCHVGEKAPAPGTSNETHGRRKGLSTSATRATTSKQACDQCVQSSLPCDGCNPCAKCVQRKVRCTFVKFHRQTAPIGPGHNPSRSTNSSASTSTSHVPPVQQTVGFNPAASAYGPMYGSYEIPSSLASLGYHGDEDSFMLNPAPGSSSFAANYRAAQADLHRRASLPSFSASTQPWASGWQATNDGPSPIPYSVDAQFAYDVGNEYRDPPFTLRHPHTQPPQHAYQNHSHPHASSTTSLNSFSSSSSSNLRDRDSRPGTASDISDSELPSRPGTSSSFADSRPGTSAGGGHVSDSNTSTNNRENGGFSSAFGLMSLDDPAVLAGLATDGTPFFSHLTAMTDPQLQQSRAPQDPAAAAVVGLPLDEVGLGTGLGMRNDPDATPMPIGEAQAMGLVGPPSSTSNGPPPAAPPASSFSSPQHHFPRTRPSTGQGRSGATANWNLSPGGGGGELGTPAREAETKELREFWKAYMRTPLSGPGAAAGGLLAVGSPTHSDMPFPIHNNNVASSSSPNGGYRRQRVSSLPSAKTPTAISDEERYAAGFVGFSGSYGGGAKYSNHHQQTQQPQQMMHPQRGNSMHLHPNHPIPPPPAHANHHGAPADGAGGMTLHGNSDDLRSYEAAVLARKAPVNLTMGGLGGKLRRKGGGHAVAAGDVNANVVFTSHTASSASPAAALTPAGSSPSSTSSVNSSPAIPHSIPNERMLSAALSVEGADGGASRRPSFKRGASQVLEKGGSGKQARRSSSASSSNNGYEDNYVSGAGAGGFGKFDSSLRSISLADSVRVVQ